MRQLIISSVFNILRIYALWEKNWRVALPVGVIGLGITCIGVVSSTISKRLLRLISSNLSSLPWYFQNMCPHSMTTSTGGSTLLWPGFGIDVSISTSRESKAVTQSRVVPPDVIAPSALSAEILMVILTIMKTYHMPNVTPAVTFRQQLSRSLLKNGDTSYTSLISDNLIAMERRSSILCVSLKVVYSCKRQVVLNFFSRVLATMDALTLSTINNLNKSSVSCTSCFMPLAITISRSHPLSRVLQFPICTMRSFLSIRRVTKIEVLINNGIDD